MSRYVPLMECGRDGCPNLVRSTRRGFLCNVCKRNDREAADNRAR